MLSQHDEPKRQWRDKTLLLQPPRGLPHDTAGGVLSAGTRGLAVVSISEEDSWLWVLRNWKSTGGIYLRANMFFCTPGDGVTHPQKW